jgi:anthranilate synthase component 1
MYTPDLHTFKKLAQHANLIPVYREISADLETPVSAYLKIARPGPGRQGYSFLLESVEGGENLARYSFIGAHPSMVMRTGPGEKDGEVDPLRLLREHFSLIHHASAPGLPRFHGGAVGYVAYDAIRYFEPRVPPLKGRGMGVPESVFMFTDALLIFDHVKHTITVLSQGHIEGDPEAAYTRAAETVEDLVRRLEGPLPPGALRRAPGATDGGAMVAAQAAMDYAPAPDLPARGRGPVRGQPAVPNMTKERYVEMVERGKQDIYEGEIIQVVLSQRLSRRTDVHPFDLYRSLRAINPSPYMFYLDLEDFQIVGASPELLVQVIDGQVAVHPIAGTRRRGATPEEDAALAKELAMDEKERAEHVMLLDLGRNDVGRVASPGTVKVTQQMDIERYSHVMHLVSHVTGQLKPELDAFEALRAGFPAGTVSGAPKVRAMEIIAELEPDKRGVYSGAVGYFAYPPVGRAAHHELAEGAQPVAQPTGPRQAQRTRAGVHTGNMDTAIAIRTIVVKDGVAHMQAGGGIVMDSTPEGEYQESLQKMRALMRAIDHAEENMS